MKKRDIVDLIKAHVMHNDATFKDICYDIAKDFSNNNDEELADYIVSIISESNNFVPQGNDNENSSFFTKLNPEKIPLFLPEPISSDVMGIINAVQKDAPVNKFLFVGESGTGKTQTAKHLARILNKQILSVNFDEVVNSKLGQTAKNIVSLFKEINSLPMPDKYLVLFDEIDAIALDRLNSKDVREMGRATSTLLKELENMNKQVLLVATSNLFEYFDKALIRRFDYVVNFNRYSEKDIYEIADSFVSELNTKYGTIKKDSRLLHKILSLSLKELNPGFLKNLIKSSIIFSSMSNESDYLVRIYKTLNKSVFKTEIEEINFLANKGFTCREISALTGISKSSVSRLNSEVCNYGSK